MPPATKQPAAVGGQPSSSMIHLSASFSAKIAPAPVSQIPANTFAALVTRSNATAARVGADGMYARFIGSSCERVAGNRMSQKTRSASVPPIPAGVTVQPAAAASSDAGRAVVFESVGRATRCAAHSTAARTSSVSLPHTS